MISTMRNRFLATFITCYMMLFVSSPAIAAMVPSMGSSMAGNQEFQKDINTIQHTLESKLVQEKLKAYGLTPDEVSTKLSSMTPAQIHILSVASQDILAGGTGLGLAVGISIIIVFVVAYFFSK